MHAIKKNTIPVYSSVNDIYFCSVNQLNITKYNYKHIVVSKWYKKYAKHIEMSKKGNRDLIKYLFQNQINKNMRFQHNNSNNNNKTILC